MDSDSDNGLDSFNMIDPDEASKPVSTPPPAPIGKYVPPGLRPPQATYTYTKPASSGAGRHAFAKEPRGQKYVSSWDTVENDQLPEPTESVASDTSVALETLRKRGTGSVNEDEGRDEDEDEDEENGLDSFNMIDPEGESRHVSIAPPVEPKSHAGKQSPAEVIASTANEEDSDDGLDSFNMIDPEGDSQHKPIETVVKPQATKLLQTKAKAKASQEEEDSDSDNGLDSFNIVENVEAPEKTVDPNPQTATESTPEPYVYRGGYHFEEEEEVEVPTFLQPAGYGTSRCGYCTDVKDRYAPPTSKSYGMSAPQLAPRVYQELMDRGWRRSGDYVYHPDNANTCCPQLTIRLDVTEFAPAKDARLRQIMNRWKKFVLTNEHGPPKENTRPDGTLTLAGAVKKSLQSPKPVQVRKEKKPEVAPVPGFAKGLKTKISKPQVPWVKPPKKEPPVFDFLKELHAPEFANAGRKAAHEYKVELVPAKATRETFNLYEKYQKAVHGDPPGKNTIGSFRRFLCDNPLGSEKIRYSGGRKAPSSLPQTYGCYHQLHRIGDVLIAFSVIDILPDCVSSVYFVWDPDYAWASLGKLSALREAALAMEMREAGAEDVCWLYMGYYIHSCPKMRYKGAYSPSYILDPGTNEFHLLDEVKPLLDANPTGYHPFVGGLGRRSFPRKQVPANQSDYDDWPEPPPPGFTRPRDVKSSTLREMVVYTDDELVPLSEVRVFRRAGQAFQLACELIAAVGEDMIATETTQHRNVFITF